ncbi:MAG: hypothetical protein IMY70_06195 [Bacteroidetes bacterium]|nr:hypothetical protein [Bacteroidota bacterium]
MKITSNKIIINQPAEEIFSFLENLEHFEQLMPEQVINWQATPETCSFTIKGMADISLQMNDKKQYSFICISSVGKAPFDFNLNIYLETLSKSETEVFIDLDAKVSPMLAMMAKRPLQNLVNYMVEELLKYYQ